MFDSEYLERYVYPVARALAEDKVAEVRSTATLVVSQSTVSRTHAHTHTLSPHLHSYCSSQVMLGIFAEKP